VRISVHVRVLRVVEEEIANAPLDLNTYTIRVATALFSFGHGGFDAAPSADQGNRAHRVSLGFITIYNPEQFGRARFLLHESDIHVP
jgi:hypothetical protein